MTSQREGGVMSGQMDLSPGQNRSSNASPEALRQSKIGDPKHDSLAAWLKNNPRHAKSTKAQSREKHSRKSRERIPKLPDVVPPAKHNNATRVVSQRKSTELKMQTYRKQYGGRRIGDAIVTNPLKSSIDAGSQGAVEKGSVVLQQDSVLSDPKAGMSNRSKKSSVPREPNRKAGAHEKEFAPVLDSHRSSSAL